jgi:hypothetical protein
VTIRTYIAEYEIPEADILSAVTSDEALSFEGEFTVNDEYTIKIDNVDKTAYDISTPDSFFYQGEHIGDDLVRYDDETGRTIVNAVITNLTADDSTLEITVESPLSQILEKNCQYTNATNKTPAQIIYELLTDEDNGNLDAGAMVYAGFQNGIAIQAAASAYVNVAYADSASGDEASGTTIGTVINELLRISHGHLYQVDGLIYYYQYEPYDGSIGNQVYADDIVAGSFKTYFSNGATFPEYHSYAVAYANSTAILYATGGSSASGTGRFMVPDTDPDSTTAEDFNILYRNATGAAWSGSTAISRFGKLLQICEFKAFGDLDFIHVGDQVDLRFDYFYGEPCLVIEREVEEDSDTIRFKCLFLNTPVEIVDRDTTAPDTIEMDSATFASGACTVKFTKSDATDHLYYRLYFTSGGNWKRETCNLGKSPVIINSSTLSSDGFIYAELLQLNSDATYRFKVTDVDSSLNESDYSNVVEST